MPELMSHEPPPPDDEPEPEPEPEPEQEPEPEAVPVRQAAPPAVRRTLGQVITQLLDQAKHLGDAFLKERKDDLIQAADALQIADAKSYEQAAELAKMFQSMLKEADAHFDEDIATAHKLHKSLTTKKNEWCSPLQNALASLKIRAKTWWDEQERLRLEEQRRVEAADRQRREDERRRLEEEARRVEKTDKAAAQEIRQEAAAVDDAPPPPPPPSRAPVVKGMTHRQNWQFRITDKKAFIAAVAGADQMVSLVERRIAEIAAHDPAEGTNAAVVLQELNDLLIAMKGVSPAISLEAVEENAVYMRGRAKTDRNTLKWPGVQIYDAGSTSVRS